MFAPSGFSDIKFWYWWHSSLSVVNLCALDDPMLVTLSLLTGQCTSIMVYNPTKLGCYKAIRMAGKATGVCHVT